MIFRHSGPVRAAAQWHAESEGHAIDWLWKKISANTMVSLTAQHKQLMMQEGRAQEGRGYVPRTLSHALATVGLSVLDGRELSDLLSDKNHVDLEILTEAIRGRKGSLASSPHLRDIADVHA